MFFILVWFGIWQGKWSNESKDDGEDEGNRSSDIGGYKNNGGGRWFHCMCFLFNYWGFYELCVFDYYLFSLD